MARFDNTPKIQIRAIEALLMSGDLFTYGGLSDTARRAFGVDEGKTGLVRQTITRLHDQGKLTVSPDGRLRATSPAGGY
jgi:hypothetical protein